MSISRGITYSSTEQITNTKLHNLIDTATLSISASEISSSMLTSLASSAGKIAPQNLWEMVNVVTNSSLATISRGTAFNLYYTTYASLATFINARVGQMFTLIAQQASFPVVMDVGNFKLAGNWIPVTKYDNLNLIFDGTVFIERGRTAV